ncbi:MAG: GNAT family N-acetyltransferase [Elusimicrobia bacterium]|nr:GNAT family N-acetyltransferase [Elusimicrobiota bacterium]
MAKKPAALIAGPRLYLRRVRVADVTPRYVAWLNDPDVNRYLEVRYANHTAAGVRKYVASMEKDGSSVFCAIVLKNGDRHIGNIKIGPVNSVHKFADVSLVIGEKDCWGHGYATEAIRLITRYGFERLGLAKIEAGVYVPNQGSTKAFLKAGYRNEGLERRKFQCGDERVDGVRLGCLPGELTEN